MTVGLLALSSAFLVFSELAGVLVASSAEPLGAVSSCREVRHQLVRTTRTGDAADLNKRPMVRPAVLPSNLEVASVFRPFLDKMWQASPTFRGQCRRLAAGTSVHLSVLVEDLPRPSPSYKARTLLRHQDGSLVSAQVYLKPSLDAPEFIAHELEHILEQLDGVDLQAQSGSGVVWKADDGAFETRRAIEVGRRVAREITTGSDATDVRHLAHENHADRLTTVVQQDRNAMPSSVRSARVSGSGRYVVFVASVQLVEGARNHLGDVYVLDLATGECTLESVGPAGLPGNGASLSPDISRDGRYVVFESAAGNLLDTQMLPGIFHVFLRDREKGVTRLLSANANGEPANGRSSSPAIDAGGTAVVFESTATDLLEAVDTVGNSVGIYVIWLATGVRTRLDLTSIGGQPKGQSMTPSISADGRFIAFVSKADLTCGEASLCVTERSDRNGVADIYLRDTQTNTTRRISRSYAGGDLDGRSYDPAISTDGRHVAFVSEATNVTRDSTHRAAHIYVHDLATGITELVSRTPSGRPANGPSLRPALSQDGATVAFQSLASNLVCEAKCQTGQPDINLVWDVFVYDRFARRNARVSTDIGEEWMEDSRAPSLDDAGQVLAFGSRHPINERDEARDEDLYVYRLRRPLVESRRRRCCTLTTTELSPKPATAEWSVNLCLPSASKLLAHRRSRFSWFSQI